MNTRRDWIEVASGADAAGPSVRRQCDLAGVARSWVYARASGEVVDELDVAVLGLIDAEDTRRPFYGSRRMVVMRRAQGFEVGRKRVQRLMRVLGLAGMVPGPHICQAPRFGGDSSTAGRRADAPGQAPGGGDGIG